MGATRPVRSLVIDSQAMIWFLHGDPRLPMAAAAAMDDDESFWFVPAICICEVMSTLRKGKYRLPFADVRSAIETSGRVEVVAIDYAIVMKSLSLHQLDGIHDQLIVATAMRLLQDRPSLRLVTSDAAIHASNLVPTLW